MDLVRFPNDSGVLGRLVLVPGDGSVRVLALDGRPLVTVLPPPTKASILSAHYAPMGKTLFVRLSSGPVWAYDASFNPARKLCSWVTSKLASSRVTAANIVSGTTPPPPLDASSALRVDKYYELLATGPGDGKILFWRLPAPQGHAVRPVPGRKEPRLAPLLLAHLVQAGSRCPRQGVLLGPRPVRGPRAHPPGARWSLPTGGGAGHLAE